MRNAFLRGVAYTTLLLLGLLLLAYLLFFVDHIWRMLAFAYPIDYGEGPLLAQIDRLRSGTPIWQLYADPSAPPYLIINYPPLYLLLCGALGWFGADTLLAGRLLSCLSALGCAVALAALTAPHLARTPRTAGQGFLTFGSSLMISLLSALLFLSVPVVREWAALLRVDLLGVCLGLWGLVLLHRGGARRMVLAALLLLACLFTKPSLIAAPGAACAWMAWRAYGTPAPARAPALRDTLLLALLLAGGGAFLFALLQWASGGWFSLHVLAANANRWELPLALGFWLQQARLRWPLAAAAALAAYTLWHSRPRSAELSLALLYTGVAIVGAVGVGKVGAYSNYFLELYAGLCWLVGLGLRRLGEPSDRAHVPADSRSRLLAPNLAASTILGLLIVALLYYPPLWDPQRLRPAGLLEPSPPRLIFGNYSMWEERRREEQVLGALARGGAALTAEVRAAGPRILTDLPGIAAAAAVESRLQAFEVRQLYDQGLADESALLIDLANGNPPLAAIDYLGNWLSPALVEILQRRYAHDGALGTVDLFRPVEAGPSQAVGVRFATATWSLDLPAYRLSAPAGASYEPGEILALALEWQRSTDTAAPPADLHVVLGLHGTQGATALANDRALLYGVLPPAHWPAETRIQHMQPFELPDTLAPGTYTLTVALRDGNGATLGSPQELATFALRPAGGRRFAETGYFVPARLLQAWANLGALERAGLPLTPAVPFAWGRLQCFERVCLELRGDRVAQRALGARHYLSETARTDHCRTTAALPATQLCPAFAGATERFSDLGTSLSGEIDRYGWIVQWTEYARLERLSGEGAINLGRLGDDALRLAPGTRYRWP